MVGQEVDQYRIVRLIGEGGMGQVFEAIDRSGRRAAIKVLRPEYASDVQMSARFINEARAIRLVEHPGVVTIFDVGVLPGGAAYIAMEFLVGVSLRERIRDPSSLHGQYLDIAHQVAMTLASVHARRIVHRDLKPENIMLVADTRGATGLLRAKLLDFGIAKLAATSQVDVVKTQTGVLMGTPTYMAPEQCGGPGEICDRTDVYALGIMLYEMLTGRPPFCGEQDSQIIGRQLFMKPQPISELLPSIDARLATLVHRMLAKNPGERPEMLAVSCELEQLQRRNPAEFRALPTAVFGMARPAPLPLEHISTLTQATGQTPLRRPSQRFMLVGAAVVALLLGTILPQAAHRWLFATQTPLGSGSPKPAGAPERTADVKAGPVSTPMPGPVMVLRPDSELKSVPMVPDPVSPTPVPGPVPRPTPPRRPAVRPAAPVPSVIPVRPAEPAKAAKSKSMQNVDIKLFR